VGRFEVLGRLGAGGMGEVYLARDPRLGRRVALKVLPPELAQDAERVRRFEQEARAASALNHPNVCTIHDIGETEDGRTFIAMEHVQGQTLRQRLASGPLPVAGALSAARQAAEALAAAHRAGIVHRDIKPENLMLREDGYLKVLDFGLAKLLEAPDGAAAEPGPAQTVTGAVMGTVRYMSPEQARGLPVDARTDVWALGAVLYELLSGRPAFAGATAGDLIAAILLTEPAPLSARGAEVPAELERVVGRALRKAAEERYASGGELARELKQLEQALKHGRLGAGAAGQTELTARLEAPGAPQAHAPPGRQTNLPPRTSTLIGRERELEEITALVRGGEVRLLTLTGPGGTGKTRLAVEAGRLLLAEFADGAFAVDLTPLADAQFLASHVAQALGLKEASGAPIGEQLARHLAARHLLVVLDNFEHLLEAAPALARLLDAAPGLMLVVTSQALLHLRLEREYAVEPLAVPPPARALTPEQLERTPAVALFVERAREARPSFALTAENAQAVAEICRRLDGLPLALELAAARVKLFAPQALLSKLEHRLKLLVGGARDLPSRQQTMRGAISWSYELLDGAERALLRRLAVFAGGCTLEAAERVASCELRVARPEGSQDSDLATHNSHVAKRATLDVLDGLGSLVDKSLLRQREEADGEVRFPMLEIVREFALEQLEACGEAEAARQAHARYFLELAEEAEPELLGLRDAVWLERLEAEHDNVRAALAWLLERDADACLRLAGAVRYFWVRHGHYTEGRQWLEAALERSRTAPAPVRAKALAGAGTLAQREGDLAAARGYYAEFLRVSREAGDTRMIGWASCGLGAVASQQGDLPAARMYAEEGLAHGRAVKDDRLTASALNSLGELAREEGAWAEARELYEQSLAVYRQAGDQAGVSTALVNLGAVAWEAGDLEGAGAAYRKALGIAQALGLRVGIGDCLEGLGAVAAGQGAWARAARLGGAAEALREAIGAPLEPLEQRLHDGWLGRLREALSASELEREWGRGRAMGVEEPVREALEAGEG
jgi:non-specific serine/threonine protein kinase